MAAVPELASQPRARARRSPRPDPRLGVFETLLVVGGHPVELDAHLVRLTASLTALYPDHEAPELADEVRARARDVALGSVRLTVAPPSRAAIEVRALPPGDFLSLYERNPPGPAVPLQTLALDGGLGRHKWADRTLLDIAQGGLSADTLPLVVDRDGCVLEASRANVFAVRGGALFTPPLDGRILPGVTRKRVLELAAAAGLRTAESELSRNDLLAADEVFLTGSVRGVELAGSLDGTALPVDGEIGRRIAAELRRTWIDPRFG